MIVPEQQPAGPLPSVFDSLDSARPDLRKTYRPLAQGAVRVLIPRESTTDSGAPWTRGEWVACAGGLR